MLRCARSGCPEYLTTNTSPTSSNKSLSHPLPKDGAKSPGLAAGTTPPYHKLPRYTKLWQSPTRVLGYGEEHVQGLCDRVLLDEAIHDHDVQSRHTSRNLEASHSEAVSVHVFPQSSPPSGTSCLERLPFHFERFWSVADLH